MEKIKIGIIGLGKAWERLHAPAFCKLRDKFEIVAVCDADMGKAKAAAEWMGLPAGAAYDDYNCMLTRKDMDAADTMVPIRGNFEVAAAVIKSGRHLLAEKPLAATPEAAKKLISLKDKKGVKVMAAENYRYDEENVLIKNLIAEHRIGTPVYFIDNNVTEFQKEMLSDGFASTDWRKHPEFAGGVLLDSGVHHIARQRFLFGEVVSLYAAGRPSEADFSPYSCVNALLTFNNGIAGHYSFFMIGKETQAPLAGLRIFGTGGEIYLENRDCGFVNVSYKDGAHEAIPYNPGQGYLRELENFHAAVCCGAEIVSTPEKELGDIETVFKILDFIKKYPSTPVDSGSASAAETRRKEKAAASALDAAEKNKTDIREKTKAQVKKRSA